MPKKHIREHSYKTRGFFEEYPIASVSLHSESSVSKYLQFPILDARPFKIKCSAKEDMRLQVWITITFLIQRARRTTGVDADKEKKLRVLLSAGVKENSRGNTFH